MPDADRCAVCDKTTRVGPLLPMVAADVLQEIPTEHLVAVAAGTEEPTWDTALVHLECGMTNGYVQPYVPPQA